MRIRSAYIWLMLALTMLLPKTNSTGHRLVRRQQRKRMAWPENLFADFAAINSAAGREAGGSGSYSAAGAKFGFIGASTSGSEGGCVKNDAKCDVKQIFGTGDPKQRTSCIAIKAAQDAKAANEAQQAAGQLAAQHIKQELAEKAFQSAKAAEAALMGKQLILQQLEQEMQEAHAVVEEESNSLQMTESNMNAAVEAARVATQQFETLTELQKSAKGNLYNIQAVATGSQQEMSAKVQLLEAARNRLVSLQDQLQGAREDYEKTKQAAYKAACAAVEAKQKASSTNDSRNRRRQRKPMIRLRSVAT